MPKTTHSLGATLTKLPTSFSGGGEEDGNDISILTSHGWTSLQGPKGDPGDMGPAGPSTGPAGGDLTGSYPNPTAVKASGPSFTVNGRLLIPTPGVTAGLLLGGDTNLYRLSAGWLKTDGDFFASRIWAADGTAAQVVIGGLAGGGIEFGTANDAKLYRSGANMLRTDSALTVGRHMRLGYDQGYGVAGALLLGGAANVNLYAGAADVLQTDDTFVVGGEQIEFGTGGDVTLWRDSVGKLFTNADFYTTGTLTGNGAVPSGGTTGQVLAKTTATDHDTQWIAFTTTYKGNWSGSTNYVKGDIVWYGTGFWIGVAPLTGDPPNPGGISEWLPISEKLPIGGTTGQVLAKKTATDYDTNWINPPAGGGGTIPMDGWHTVGGSGEPAFTSVWGTSGTPLQFRKDPLGRVHLRGAAMSLSTFAFNTNSIFQLPLGYRPGVGTIGGGIVQCIEPDGVTVSTLLFRVNGSGTMFPSAQASGAASRAASSLIYLDEIEFDTDSVTQMPTGPQGAKGDTGATGMPLRVVGTLPSPGTTGDMLLYQGAVWFNNGTTWQQVGTGSGGGSRAFSFFTGGSDG